MASALVCQELLAHAKAALSNLEKTMVQLQHLEENLNQQKVQQEEEHAKVEAERKQVEQDRRTLDVEKAAMMKNSVGSNDLIGLNFRGEKTVIMKRSVLCKVEGSMLSAMFSGRHEDNLDRDKDGNVYVSYPPSVMMPLMDWLTVCQDLPPEIKPPAIDIPQGQKRMWDGTLKLFGLEPIACPASAPSVFSGLGTRIPIRALRGWTMAVRKRSKEPITWEDFSLTGISRDSLVLVGAKQPGTDELIMAAIGRLDVITTPGTRNRKHNKVYWSTSADLLCFTRSQFARFVTTQGFNGRISHMSRHCEGFSFISPYQSRHDNFERIIMIPIGPIIISDE